MSYYRITKIIISLFVLSLMINCKSDSADLLFDVNDEGAEAFYTSNLKAVIDEKCISCHIYHLEGASKYDSYEKAKASMTQILERTNASDNTIMPPTDQVALTDEEKQMFNDFVTILNSTEKESETLEEVKPFEVNWVAYKYPDRFEGRDGAGVGGTFDEIEYAFNMDYENAIDILEGAEINIITSSVNVANNEPTRTTNVGVFFEYFTPDILGKVVAYDDEQAIVEFTMNDMSNTTTLNIELNEDDSIITLTGAIPDLNEYEWIEGYNAIQQVCGELHEGTLWPDVDIEAIIRLDQLNVE